MQVGEKDDFIICALRQLGRHQRLCAHRRGEGTPAAPGDEAADDYLDQPLRWQQMLTEKGFHVLRNADTVIDGRIKITGIDDYSKERTAKQLLNLAGANKSYYSILLDHQPRRMDAAASAGYDLYLAGHTHTGQLFPNRIVTKMMYKLDYGRTRAVRKAALTIVF